MWHRAISALTLREAVFQAGPRRLRPILMTALATVFGMLPLALGVGSGAQMLQPLAIAVIGGVSVSMILSLLDHARTFLLVAREGTVGSFSGRWGSATLDEKAVNRGVGCVRRFLP
jgi:multidrug efflux pump subunit AcrB